MIFYFPSMPLVISNKGKSIECVSCATDFPPFVYE